MCQCQCSAQLPPTTAATCRSRASAITRARDAAQESALQPYAADITILSNYYQRLWVRGRANYNDLPAHLKSRVRPRQNHIQYDSVDRHLTEIANAIGRYYVALSHPYVQLLDSAATFAEADAVSGSAPISVGTVETQLRNNTLFRQQNQLVNTYETLQREVLATATTLAPIDRAVAGGLTLGGVTFAAAGLTAAVTASLISSSVSVLLTGTGSAVTGFAITALGGVFGSSFLIVGTPGGAAAAGAILASQAGGTIALLTTGSLTYVGAFTSTIAALAGVAVTGLFAIGGIVFAVLIATGFVNVDFVGRALGAPSIPRERDDDEQWVTAEALAQFRQDDRVEDAIAEVVSQIRQGQVAIENWARLLQIEQDESYDGTFGNQGPLIPASVAALIEQANTTYNTDCQALNEEYCAEAGCTASEQTECRARGPRFAPRYNTLLNACECIGECNDSENQACLEEGRVGQWNEAESRCDCVEPEDDDDTVTPCSFAQLSSCLSSGWQRAEIAAPPTCCVRTQTDCSPTQQRACGNFDCPAGQQLANPPYSWNAATGMCDCQCEDAEEVEDVEGEVVEDATDCTDAQMARLRTRAQAAGRTIQSFELLDDGRCRALLDPLEACSSSEIANCTQRTTDDTSYSARWDSATSTCVCEPTKLRCTTQDAINCRDTTTCGENQVVFWDFANGVCSCVCRDVVVGTGTPCGTPEDTALRRTACEVTAQSCRPHSALRLPR